MIHRKGYTDFLLNISKLLLDDVSYLLLKYFVDKQGDEIIDTIIEEDLGIRIDLLNKYIIRLHNYGLIEYKEKKIERTMKTFYSLSDSFFHSLEARLKVLKKNVNLELEEKEITKYKCNKCNKVYKLKELEQILMQGEDKCPHCSNRLIALEKENVTELKKKVKDIFDYINTEYEKAKNSGFEYDILGSGFNGKPWINVMKSNFNKEFIQLDKIKNGKSDVNDIEFKDLEPPSTQKLIKELEEKPESNKAKIFNDIMDVYNRDNFLRKYQK